MQPLMTFVTPKHLQRYLFTLSNMPYTEKTKLLPPTQGSVPSLITTSAFFFLNTYVFFFEADLKKADILLHSVLNTFTQSDQAAAVMKAVVGLLVMLVETSHGKQHFFINTIMRMLISLKKQVITLCYVDRP